MSWLISLPHAMKMVKKMGIKKHRAAGYSFDLSEVADQAKAWSSYAKSFYADYKLGTTIYKLEIYYEKPHEAPDKKGKPDRGGRK